MIVALSNELFHVFTNQAYNNYLLFLLCSLEKIRINLNDVIGYERDENRGSRTQQMKQYAHSVDKIVNGESMSRRFVIMYSFKHISVKLSVLPCSESPGSS